MLGEWRTRIEGGGNGAAERRSGAGGGGQRSRERRDKAEIIRGNEMNCSNVRERERERKDRSVCRKMDRG